MRQGKFTRRDVLKGSAAAAITVYANPLRAAAPPAEAITPALIEAAKKEGKLAFYTAMDLAFAQRLANTFERISWYLRARRALRRRAHIHPIAQDTRSTSRLSTWSTPPIRLHWHRLKRNQWLAPYMPRRREAFGKDYYDPEACM